MENIDISICCLTYNHENFIADAIESFLMQETSYRYEILIHDDASTDKTPEIIEEYRVKYSNIIKPLYQKENQYSKGVSVSKINMERAGGKYIALCEGDDYWIDIHKLQQQVDFLEKNNEFSLCVHSGDMVDVNNKKVHSVRPFKNNKVYKTEELILGGGDMFPTNSMLFKTEHIKVLPKFYNISPVGDYPLVIYLSLKGKVYYIDRIMSAYRVGVGGSWTQRVSSNIFNAQQHYNLMNNVMLELNKYTNYMFDGQIDEMNNRRKLNLLCIRGEFDKIKNGELEKYYNDMKLSKRITIYLRCKYPRYYAITKKLLRKIHYAKLK
ncbi:MAG: glycosyltransferase family 2 protein [Tissierella sp.]|uniref:glycosyltransferase family 2 protein n=1 Tax=Tissierella sp. TaxID=41274 RepID=UPI003F9B077E